MNGNKSDNNDQSFSSQKYDEADFYEFKEHGSSFKDKDSKDECFFKDEFFDFKKRTFNGVID